MGFEIVAPRRARLWSIRVRRQASVMASAALRGDHINAWIASAALLGIPFRLARACFWLRYFRDMRAGLIDYADGYHGPDGATMAQSDPLDDERSF